jgi:hypothetical protein
MSINLQNMEVVFLILFEQILYRLMLKMIKIYDIMQAIVFK